MGGKVVGAADLRRRKVAGATDWRGGKAAGATDHAEAHRGR
jgi:hypothetical protein